MDSSGGQGAGILPVRPEDTKLQVIELVKLKILINCISINRLAKVALLGRRYNKRTQPLA